MAWAHVQDSPGANGTASGSGTTLNTGAFGSANTISDQIVVFFSSSFAYVAANITCSDNATTPNTYTQIGFQGGTGCCCAIFLASITSLPASGNLNPKITAATSHLLVACAAEFSGGTTTLDGSAVSTFGTSLTNIQPGVMSTTIAGDLLLSIAAENANVDGSFATPTSYTSVGNHAGATPSSEGDYQIITGTVSGNNPSYNITAASSWAALQVAIQKALTSGGFPQSFPGSGDIFTPEFFFGV